MIKKSSYSSGKPNRGTPNRGRPDDKPVSGTRGSAKKPLVKKPSKEFFIQSYKKELGWVVLQTDQGEIRLWFVDEQLDEFQTMIAELMDERQDEADEQDDDSRDGD